MLRALVVLVVALQAQAQPSQPVRVQQKDNASIWLDRPEHDSNSVKMSEKLTIFIRVEGKPPLEVEFTEKIHDSVGWHLEFLGKPKTTLSPDEAEARWEQAFVATPLRPGTQPLQLPALQYSANGGEEQSVSWEPIQLEVKTRLAKADLSELRDRTGIEELPPAAASTPWWPWLLLALPIVVTLAFFRRRHRQRPKVQPQSSSIALHELDELSARSVANDEEVKRSCAELSDVVRRYIEKQFRFPATHWTTSETTRALAKETNGVPLQRLHEVLASCDRAKFAETAATRDEFRQLLTFAREFVESTRT
jgi:hypothetical protein